MAGLKACPACARMNPPTSQRCDFGYNLLDPFRAGADGPWGMVLQALALLVGGFSLFCLYVGLSISYTLLSGGSFGLGSMAGGQFWVNSAIVSTFLGVVGLFAAGRLWRRGKQVPLAGSADDDRPTAHGQGVPHAPKDSLSGPGRLGK